MYKIFVFFPDYDYDSMGQNTAFFDTVSEAQKAIGEHQEEARRNGSWVPNLEDYIVINGKQLKLKAKEYITQVEIEER